MKTYFGSALLLFSCWVAVCESTNLTETEILEFEAPDFIKENFPYYLSGYDEEGAPIWVFELGKWDLRTVVDQGGENFTALDIYGDQMWLTFRNSGRNSSAKYYFCICDMDGWNIRQASSVATIQFIISKYVSLETIIRNGELKAGWFVNSNALFERIWQVGKPLLGAVANSIELYGTNKEVWWPKLRKYLPRDQIAEWYGGHKDHRPVAIYG